MEKAYKTALEIILKMCKRESYIDTKNLILICETVLEKDTVEGGDKDECAR